MPELDPILQAHRIIREQVAAIRGTHDPTTIRACVARLAEVLPDHFDYEEHEGGFMDRIREHGDTDEVKTLLEDHQAIRSEIEVLAELDDDDELVTRGRRLANRIAKHEALENRLGASTTFEYPWPGTD